MAIKWAEISFGPVVTEWLDTTFLLSTLFFLVYAIFFLYVTALNTRQSSSSSSSFMPTKVRNAGKVTLKKKQKTNKPPPNLLTSH